MRKSKPHTQKQKGRKTMHWASGRRCILSWEKNLSPRLSKSTLHSVVSGVRKGRRGPKKKPKENCSWVWCQPNKSRTRPTPNPTALTPHPRNGWFHRYSRRLTSLQFLHPLSYKYAHLIKEVCTILWYFTSHFDDYIPRAIHILLHKQRGKFQGTNFSFTTNIFLTIQKIRGNYWKLKWNW